MSPDSGGAAGASLIARRLRLAAVCLVGLLLLGLARLALADAGYSRISLSSTQEQANGESSYDMAMSGDGRFVVFGSGASNLVPGDTNSVWDVFLRDTWADTTERVSVAADGSQADGASNFPSMTPDGRYVAFPSSATNLLGPGGDTNMGQDIFVRDRLTNVVERVSVANDGSQADVPPGKFGSAHPSISADGRYVAFESDAINLVPGDTNNAIDVFLRDRVSHTTVRVSVSTAGAQATGYSQYPSISGDGRYVAFSSSATNLVPGDLNGYNDVFVRDLVSHTTTRVSLGNGGVEAHENSWDPTISADGRYVAFESDAKIVPVDVTSAVDVYLRDRIANTTELVSAPVNGGVTSGSSDKPRISADGRRVVFESTCQQLISGDNSVNTQHIFVRDRSIGTTFRLDVSVNGGPGNSQGGYPAISADGRWVAFGSVATDLVNGDTNIASDIFERDLDAGLAPPAPTNLDAAPLNATAIELTWTDNSVNEVYFEIQRDSGAGFMPLATALPDTTFYDDATVQPGSLYIYRVRAINGLGGSEWSNIAATETPETPPAAPSNLTATVGSASKIQLAWVDNSSNEEDFRLEQRIGGQAFVEIKTISAGATSCAITGLTPATTYTYKLRAHNSGGYSDYSNSAAATTLPPPPAAPSALTAAALDSTHVSLHWTDNATNETSIKVERQTGAAAFIQIASLGANAAGYTDATAVAGTTYTFRVRSSNAGGSSGYVTSGAVTMLTAPSGLVLTVTPGQIKLDWADNSAGETGFKVERRIGAAAFAEIATTAANAVTYTNSGLAASTTYAYRVRAAGATGYSSYCAAAAGTTPPPPPTAPTALTAAATDSKHVALHWTDNALNETSFKVERKQNAGAFTEIVSLGANVVDYVDGTAAANQTYTYRVRAANAGGYSGYATAPALLTLDAPTGLALAVSPGQIKLAWTDKAANETGYKIERKTGAGAFTEIATVGANVQGYTNTGLAAGTPYTYRVRAYATSSYSSYSNTAAGTP